MNVVKLCVKYKFLHRNVTLSFDNSRAKKHVCIVTYMLISCSELSFGLYCRVERLSTDVSKVRTASIIRDYDGGTWMTMFVDYSFIPRPG
jgi:hypothetical protein